MHGLLEDVRRSAQAAVSRHHLLVVHPAPVRREHARHHVLRVSQVSRDAGQRQLPALQSVRPLARRHASIVRDVHRHWLDNSNQQQQQQQQQQCRPRPVRAQGQEAMRHGASRGALGRPALGRADRAIQERSCRPGRQVRAQHSRSTREQAQSRIIIIICYRRRQHERTDDAQDCQADLVAERQEEDFQLPRVVRRRRAGQTLHSSSHHHSARPRARLEAR